MDLSPAQLAQLVNIKKPDEVLDEVRTTVFMMSKDIHFETVESVFFNIMRLFAGKYPGYKKCNTAYHDFEHTLDTFLATARLMHGAQSREKRIDNDHIVLGLISALMHDTGYIQEMGDEIGTGAKYTSFHVPRSIEFSKKYFAQHGFSRESFQNCEEVIWCTSHDITIDQIRFMTEQNRLTGEILGTADLIGQMASRTYLEKLLFLFREFKEAYTTGFESEFDFLRKSLTFFKFVKEKFVGELGGVYRHMRDHFELRWNIDDNLYIRAIKNQMNYLKDIIENHANDYRSYLRRGGFVEKLVLWETLMKQQRQSQLATA